MTENLDALNKETHEAWEMNAEVWNNRMGDEGNDFFNILCWPSLASFLNPRPGSHILDIACGNGLTTRRLHEHGLDFHHRPSPPSSLALPARASVVRRSLPISALLDNWSRQARLRRIKLSLQGNFY